VRRLALGAVALLTGVRGAAAQRQLIGVAGLSFAEHRVDAGFGVERTAGPVITAGIALAPRPRLALELRGRAGSLPGQAAGAFDRDLGELALETRWRAMPALDVGTEVMWRSYASMVGRQRWVLVRTGIEARLPLVGVDATTLLRAAYLPVVAVPGLGTPRLAVSAGAGMEYRVGPTRLRVLFELERYDFAPVGETARRVEQLSGLSVALTMRLGRVR
jgi:hypothetical protein